MSGDTLSLAVYILLMGVQVGMLIAEWRFRVGDFAPRKHSDR